MQGASEQQGRFTLCASSKQATTQYTTQELSNSFQFRTVTELANGDFAFTTYLSDIRDPNKLVLAVFSQADGTWTVLVPEYENNMQRDQASAIRRAEAVDDLKYVMVGVIAAPIIIIGAVEIAPLAVAAMPSFSLWGGGSATTSVLGGGGGVLATKTVEYLASPRGQQVVGAVRQVSQVLLNSSRQLQAKFKHALDFGVTGSYSKSNAANFSAAINQHINSPEIQMIYGTYRGQNVVHYLNPSSGVNVISSLTGQFISGWRLNPTQLMNVLEHGGL